MSSAAIAAGVTGGCQLVDWTAIVAALLSWSSLFRAGMRVSARLRVVYQLVLNNYSYGDVSTTVCCLLVPVSFRKLLCDHFYAVFHTGM